LHFKRNLSAARTACGAFRALSFPAQCAALSRLLLVIFFFGCACTGGGRYLSLGPLTPRLLLGLFAALLALPAFLQSFRTHRKNPAILLLLLFWLWMAVCAARGLAAGNRADVLRSDLKGFLWFFLLPVCITVVQTKAQLHRLLSGVMAGAALQAACSLVCNVACALSPGLVLPLGARVLALQLGTVSHISGTLFRIFSYSGPYLILACVITVFRQAGAPRLRFSYMALTALYLNALLLTFTRSLYGAAAITAAVTLLLAALLYRENLRRLLAYLLLTVALTAALVLTQEALFQGSYLNFAASRCLGREVTISRASELRTVLADRFGILFDMPGEDSLRTEADLQRERELQEEYLRITAASDERRNVTRRELQALIAQNPVFGNGLGASVPSRESGLDELFYLDMVCRMGILGLALYLAPLAWLLFDTLRTLRRRPVATTAAQCAVLCGLAALMIASGFNPWMNAVLGIAWYSLAAALPGIGRVSPPANTKKESEA